eukprot:TRINITY_DN4397_c0_g1_i1.p1 TRINITY_DN4397_c0_g1~~TRINITY_DN4397_c0_g1_i1.p1  ORF type:complete len:1761 (-),score=350.84 TRINITY_DN4397_c0_g1_i1:33-5315(-)
MFKRKNRNKATRSDARSDDGPPQPDYLPPQKEAQPDMVNITIDDKQFRVPSRIPIIEAARLNGIKIPTLCWHPSLPPAGKCGVCMVYVEGHNPPLVKSCKTFVAEGMKIVTDNPEVVFRSNANLVEFMGNRKLADLCGQEEEQEIEDLVRFCNDHESRVDNHHRQFAIIRNNSLCCACTRCVRACSVIQNMKILSIDTESTTQPILFENNLPLHATSCIACGQCTLVCPTRAVAERDDTATVEAILREEGPGRKIAIIQTAPSSRVCFSETMGEEPGNCDTSKLVAALHAIGFNFVFDTTFAADTCSIIEAIELLDRIQNHRSLPMFTSCCPGWVRLVENKYPHLRDNLSRCKSPMMMLGALVRKYFVEFKGMQRSDYFFVALMPCIAKKEEILRSELRAKDGTSDVDIVLTTREMGRLIKRFSSTVLWEDLPGLHKATYDEPFNYCSGGGSLFPVSGGVTESVLRVASSYLANETHTDLFAACRQTLSANLAVETEVTMQVQDKPLALELAVVSGGRDIQTFLQEQSLDEPHAVKKAEKHIVECMACPGGCIMGGGQPRTLDSTVNEKRRAAAFNIDEATKTSCSLSVQRTFLEKMFGEVANDMAKEVLEYNPSAQCTPRYKKHHKHVPSQQEVMPRNASGGSIFSGIATTDTSSSDDDPGEDTWDIVIAYGSQGGSTVSRARELQDRIEQMFDRDIKCVSLDQLPLHRLPMIKFFIVMTSTWETEVSIFPYNAQSFWEYLVKQPQSSLGQLLLSTSFTVLGFGSTKYEKYCGAAVLIHQALVRLGACPLMDCVRVDVERADKGRKVITNYTNKLLNTLSVVDVPSPTHFILPSIRLAANKHKVSIPTGYNVITVNCVKPYKQCVNTKYTYVEFNTANVPGMNPKYDEYLYLLPCNPQHEVEDVLSLFSDMSATALHIVPVGKRDSKFPAHTTMKLLFSQYLDLHHKPHLGFMKALEEQINIVDRRELSEVLNSSRAFLEWANGQTYASVVKAFRSHLPSLEVLITMLPPMYPRPYAPIHFEPARDDALGICVRVYENGLCSKWLSNLKKGDKILAFLGKSPFPRPNETLLETLSAQFVDQDQVSVTDSEFPLKLSKTELTFGTKPVTPGVIACDQFDIANPSKEQRRFTISFAKPDKYEIQFAPMTGIIKPKFVITIYVLLKVISASSCIQHVISVSSQGLRPGIDKTLTFNINLRANIKANSVVEVDLLKKRPAASPSPSRKKEQNRELHTGDQPLQLQLPVYHRDPEFVKDLEQLAQIPNSVEGAQFDKFKVVSPYLISRYTGSGTLVVCPMLSTTNNVNFFPNKKSIVSMATSYPFVFTLHSDAVLQKVNVETNHYIQFRLDDDFVEVKSLLAGADVLVAVFKNQLAVWDNLDSIGVAKPAMFSITPSFLLSFISDKSCLMEKNKRVLLVNSNPTGNLFQMWSTDGKERGYATGLPGGMTIGCAIHGDTIAMSNSEGIFIWNVAGTTSGALVPTVVKYQRVPTALYLDAHTLIVGDNCGGLSLHNPDGSFVHHLIPPASNAVSTADQSLSQIGSMFSQRVTRIHCFGQWVVSGFEDSRVHMNDIFKPNAAEPFDFYVHPTSLGVRHIATSESKVLVVLAKTTPEAVLWQPKIDPDEFKLQSNAKTPISWLLKECVQALPGSKKFDYIEGTQIANSIKNLLSTMNHYTEQHQFVPFQYYQKVYDASSRLQTNLAEQLKLAEQRQLSPKEQQKEAQKLMKGGQPDKAVQDSLRVLTQTVASLCSAMQGAAADSVVNT